jgi:hypothetical protein
MLLNLSEIYDILSKVLSNTNGDILEDKDNDGISLIDIYIK